MKQVLISVGIFSAGVGLGVLATRTYFEKKYKQIADEEIESFRQYVDRAKKKIENNKKLVTSFKVTPSFGKLETLDPYPTDPMLYTTTSADTISYNEHYSKEEDKVDKAKTLSPVEEEVYEISVEEYADDTEYDKVTLNLYTEDGMLIYEEGEEIADEGLIGTENIDDFSNAPFAQAYFRDPKNKVDYEVIKVDGSYQELIAGNV